MSRRTLWRGLGLFAILVLLATLISSPYTVSLFDSTWAKVLWWFLMICLALIFLVPIGLMPYFGVREIKRDIESEKDKLASELKELEELKEIKRRQAGQRRVEYVFPYIRTVNASPIIDGDEEYLILGVYTPNALFFDLEIEKLKGYLILDGMHSRPQDIELRTIVKFRSQLSVFEIPLTKEMVNRVKEKVSKNKPVKVVLHLDVQDKDGFSYSWNTEEWTTLLLTKLD